MSLSLYWMSPTDTRATEIANYSRWLMPWLVEACEVLNAEDFLGEENPQSPLPDSDATPGREALNVYHLGNSKMHCDIYQRALQQPGLIVMHDVNLVDLAQNYAESQGDYEAWRDVIQRQYGEEVLELAKRSEKWENPDARVELAIKYPLFTPYLHGTLGVVVHSRYAEDLLRSQAPADVRLKQLYLPYPPPGPAPERDYAAPVLRFIFCGHVGPNRRIAEFIEAWGQIEDPARIRLSIYGNISMFNELQTSAEAAGVTDYLEINGFVDDIELNRALKESHFAINLRWPTMGETSSSQLRYWSNALPTIASDVGWYAEVPDEVLMKVPIDTEVASLRQLLENILQAPEEYSRFGRAGRDYLKQVHSPQNYVNGLLEFASERCTSLKQQALDGELTGIVAGLCEDFHTLALFEQPLASAAALFELSDTPTRADD